MKLHNDTNKIEKQIEIKAPIDRVWRAITGHREFSQWFRVDIKNPFVAGQVSQGRVTYPGYEHLTFEAMVERMDPERLFSLTWHPAAIESNRDYSKEPSTLVEFRLEKSAIGTLLTVTESGFDQLPPDRRDEALRMNEGGWTEQMKNIERHVTGT